MPNYTEESEYAAISFIEKAHYTNILLSFRPPHLKNELWYVKKALHLEQAAIRDSI